MNTIRVLNKVEKENFDNISINASDYLDLTLAKKIKLIRDRISKRDFEQVKIFTGLSFNEISYLLGITERTIHMKKDHETFNKNVSDKIIILFDFFDLGFQVFNDRKLFLFWLHNPSQFFGDKMPFVFLDTSIGMEIVKKRLKQIKTTNLKKIF